MIKRLKHYMNVAMIMAGLGVFSAQGMRYAQTARLFMGKMASAASAQVNRFDTQKSTQSTFNRFNRVAGKATVGLGTSLALTIAYGELAPVHYNNSSEYIALRIGWALAAAAKSSNSTILHKLHNNFLQSKYCVEIPLENTKTILDTHQEDLFKYKYEVRRFDWLPGWMVKPGHDRIEGAKIFSTAINELGYSNFIVPQKYPYTSHSGDKYTISKIVKISEEPLTPEEITQLFTLATKTNWVDTKPENIIKTPEGKIALIDTEMRGFMNKQQILEFIKTNK